MDDVVLVLAIAAIAAAIGLGLGIVLSRTILRWVVDRAVGEDEETDDRAS